VSRLTSHLLLWLAAALPADRAGLVVNILDQRVWRPNPQFFGYSLSKAALWHATRTMAQALAPRIRVNAIGPGTIATELAAQAVLTSEDAKKKILGRTPMKRLGEPSEIADVVAWLASDAASYVTGEIVTVDGGRMTLNYTVPV